MSFALATVASALLRRRRIPLRRVPAARLEQNTGIGHVSSAVTQLDEVTQRNAALVEESAAAAESLKHQAARLNAVAGRFLLAPRRSLRTA